MEKQQLTTEQQQLIDLYMDFQRLYIKLFGKKNKPIIKLKGCFISFFSLDKDDNEFLTLGRVDIKDIEKELKQIKKDYKDRGF